LANTKDVAFVPVTAMLVMDNAVVPLLVMVTACEPLDEPTVVEAKERLVADNVTGAATPVPLRATVCGELRAESFMVIAAVSAPAVVGPKWPWMEQLAPTARVLPQVFAKTNEDGSAPVKVMLEMLSGALPMLVRVM